MKYDAPVGRNTLGLANERVYAEYAFPACIFIYVENAVVETVF
jgi:hypothetical protein